MIISIRQYSRCKGLSLIELMVAMVIGLLLLTGTASMFISNKRIYREQNDMGRLQENARFAMQILTEDIRMAGYAGCADDISEIANHVNGMTDDDQMLSFMNALEGIESTDGLSAATTATPWLPSNSTGNVSEMVPGTDAIAVRYLDPTGISISSPMPTVSAELKVTTVGNLVIGDVIALSDCDSADIMQLTQVQAASSHLQHNTGSGTPGNATKNLQKKYDDNADVLRFISRRYFIGTGASGGPSLFRMENQDAAAQELVEGVENMQILYGEDTVGNDTIADTYVNAANVTNGENIVSVRLALLFRTVNEDRSNDLDTRTYNLLGTVFDPVDDRRRRRVVTNTIQIRNRAN